MPAVLKHINQPSPTQVPVIIGAAEVLVTHRELRNKYETNRSIKTWSSWFLLKSVTESCKIQRWRKQLDFLLPYLQLTERTLYRRLNEMVELQLLTIDEEESIHLISYEKAAAILEIPFSGLTKIPYNPNKNVGNQIFQYYLRAEEFRHQKDRQLSALMYHLDKNLPLKNDLLNWIVQMGADEQRLYKDPGYFQERLLQLQIKSFQEASEILSYVFARRADINRGVTAIQKHHCYKSKQSVSYLKRRMFKLRVILVEKICVESKKRSRLFIPDGDRKKEGYKWIGSKKQTALFLTDQIEFTYEVQSQKTRANLGRKTA